MAATYVKQVAGAVASAAGTTVTAPVTAASTAGNAIVVACSNSQTSGTIDTCTDTKGNTYVQVVNDKHASAAVQDAIFIARNATALTTSDSITVTVSVSTGLPALEAFEFSGLTGDSDALIQGQGGSTTAYDTGAGTVPAGPHLLFSVAAGTGNRTATPTGSGTWTALPRTPNPPSNIRTANPFYQVVSGGGTLENVGTWDSACNWVTSATAFPAGSAGTSITLAGPVATAAAVAPVGTVTAAKAVNLSGPRATVTAAAPNGSVAAGRAVTLAGPTATATATALAGAFATAGGVNVTAPAATVTATAPAGSVRADRSVTIAGPLATVTAQALAGAANVAASITLAGPVATVTAVAPAGAWQGATRDITVTWGAVSTRTLLATSAVRTLTAAPSTRTLITDPQE